jgi:hypothetical protein
MCLSFFLARSRSKSLPFCFRFPFPSHVSL